MNDALRPARDRWLRPWDALPRGGTLPVAVWERRHRGILLLLALHIPGVAAVGVATGTGLLHSVAEAVVLLVPLAIAVIARRRGVRAAASTVGLLTASALLVHLSHGLIEMHFHYFVMMGVVGLYHDWTPFLLAIGYVVGQHAIIGTLSPQSVFNHPSGIASPLKWGIVHGAFILGICVTQVMAWRLTEEALRDPVTRLPNSASLVRAADLAVERRQTAWALLFCDLDGFKGVNDRLGHHAGDHVLATVAERIVVGARRSDLVCRMGGDEFAVLLPGTGEAAAVATAARILEAVAQPMRCGKDVVRIGCSVGVAVGDGTVSTSRLMHHADIAMYAAKDLGKGRYVVFNPGNQDRADRDLHQADRVPLRPAATSPAARRPSACRGRTRTWE